MTDLPHPLVPAECTMAGNDWFPFYFQRLRKSKWWRRASDLARARNIMLWGEAYQQSPAGSMPDDDDDLAEAAGFGMDIDAFLAAKAEIMAPWVMCSDGRWYHPTLCEVVLEGWEKIGERRKKEAEKKAAQRAKVRGQKPANVPGKTAPVPRDIANVPGDTPEKTTLSPGVPAQTGQTGEDSKVADATLSPISDEKPEEYPDLFESSWKAYPHVRGRSSKRKALGFWRRLSKARRDQLPAAVARYAREGREPKAECGAPGMHRWLADEKFLDWMADTAAPPLIACRFPGPPEVREVVVAEKDEAWAVSYLDRCGWREADKAILCPTSFVADTLRAQVPALERRGASLIVEPKRTAA